MSELPKVSEQLEYLVATDEPYAHARAKVKGLEYRLKSMKAVLFMESEGSQGVREQTALSHPDFITKVNEYENAVLDMETMGAKRKTAELHIEVWRSRNANQRKGNI